AILVDVEILATEAGNETTLVIGDGRRYVHQIDTALEGEAVLGLRRLTLLTLRRHRDDAREHADREEQWNGRPHQGTPPHLIPQLHSETPSRCVDRCAAARRRWFGN